MALAYPEGECFFRREGLVSPRAGGYDARRENTFPRYMLIEYLWNVPSHSENAGVNYPNGHKHPRAGWVMTRRDSRIRQGNYVNLPFSYGPHESSIRRRLQHELCVDPWTLQDYYFGNSVAKSFFMAIPMPTEEERWVWIDMVARIRAIYLPVAYTADQHHPNLCAFVQLNFALDRTLTVWLSGTGGGRWSEHHMHKLYGLNLHPGWVIGFDVTGLISLLSLPRQLRKNNPYLMGYVKEVQTNDLRSTHLSPTSTYRHADDIDWIKVANANFGLDIQWKPTERGSWLSNFIKNVLTMALGMIPVAGPFLAIAFPLGWTLITDPDKFIDELRAVHPAIDYSFKLREKIHEAAREQRKCLPDGWEKMNLPTQGRAQPLAITSSSEESKDEVDAPPKPEAEPEEGGQNLAFTFAAEVLKNSALPKRDDPFEDDDPDHIELVNQPTDYPFEESGSAQYPHDDFE